MKRLGTPTSGPLSGQRGQTLILAAFLMTVVFVIGAIAVDIGLWVSERRGAYKDADATSLAGAQAYAGDLTNTSGAFNDALRWAVLNGVDPAKIDGSPTLDCSAGNSCIGVGTSDCNETGADSMPWVEAKIRHPGASLFASIFNVVAPDIGAAARACVGSPRSHLNLSPFGVQTGFFPPVGSPETGAQCDNDTDDDGDGVVNDGCPLSDCLEPMPGDPSRTRPVYGSVCILKTGAQDQVSGQRGQLTLGNLQCDQKSSNTLRHDFHYGALAECTLGQEVNTGSGNILGLLQGLNDRLLEEGRCDQLFYTGHPGYDDFDEVFSLIGAGPGDPVVPSADNVFVENPCTITSGQDGVAPDPWGHVHTYNPRVLDLVLIDQLEQGQQTATITGFAGFYPIGCYDDSIARQTAEAIEVNLRNMGSYMNRCDNAGAKDDILGVFVQTLAEPLNVGDPDPNLPLAIVLVK